MEEMSYTARIMLKLADRIIYTRNNVLKVTVFKTLNIINCNINYKWLTIDLRAYGTRNQD